MLETLVIKLLPLVETLARLYTSEERTSYLDGEVVCHHAVPGRQVSVDELVGVEVGHAVGDLSCHLDHLLQRRETEGLRLLEEDKRHSGLQWRSPSQDVLPIFRRGQAVIKRIFTLFN